MTDLRFVVAAAVLAAPASAQDAEPTRPAAAASRAPVLVSADIRPGIDLTGIWHYSVDPYRSGLAGFHGKAPNASDARWADIDVGETMRRDTRTEFEFDMDRAPIATLPGSWLTHSAEMRHYQGLVWYQKHFAAKKNADKRVFLRFGAANYTTRVYMNGKPVGQHEGGFTPFAFDVTEVLREGDNQITIGVDSAATKVTVPPPVTDWENYGGITREIRLIETPRTYVDDAWVRLNRTGQLAIDVHLDGPQAAGRPISLTIAGLATSMSGRTDAHGDWRATATAPRSLVRWSPDRPQLYDVAVSAGEDVWRDRIGFRTVETRGSDILLNGRPIFLRGISVHEEELGSNPARTMTPAASRALLTEAKEGLHANFVRLAHYPHSEVTLRMADQLGLLVWSEIPVYWMIAWDDPATLATARRMIAENIRRDRNRAAIGIWSVANETPATDARNAFLGTLIDDVRKLDDSRLVSAALLVDRAGGKGPPVMTMNDPLAARLDVLSINTYNGWYSGDPLSALPASEWHVPSDKPVLLSEFGADAKAGFHDGRGSPQKFSEEFQAEYYRSTLAMARRMPTLRGMSPWILKDFRSPRRQNEFQQGWNRKGLISETGQRKMAFDVLADFYAERTGR
ncbi:glycoside hydrolase family 2 protein [Sphingomonas sp. R86521]|uniref:glycoside hydrolase family 2 protein n=1 Tax=Sphingomonas sp. R86521 TaxID=3093860 RepID=UPI0036D371E1